jgi:hypothetical protein
MTSPYETAPSQHIIQFSVSENAWFQVHSKIPRKGNLNRLMAKLYSKLELLVIHANLPDNHPDNLDRISALIDTLALGNGGVGLSRNHGGADDRNVRRPNPSLAPGLPGGKDNPNGTSRKGAPQVGGVVRKNVKKEGSPA